MKDGKRSIIVDTSRCTGCGRCVSACSSRLITLDTIGSRKVAWVKFPERCSLCGRCITECPIGAMAEYPPKAAPQ
ncbi:4Fe-4S binding protein [Geobacter pelophilus]|uniref:4Fe-4S binding protein n=1 Tax=Geoanaerobacter pelophilus TaxID=60036 RepID=A0AAW4L5M9_9BACT|nr:4Fe-4S binding protein [Geoanaerobacter pelophilus]MBT0666089.1 4Fe-4S binding protein [Geoanaerobacter pelophilus]